MKSIPTSHLIYILALANFGAYTIVRLYRLSFDPRSLPPPVGLIRGVRALSKLRPLKS